jgi:RecA/RadA recombinase
MEMNLDPIVELISEKAIDLVVYDSIAAVSSAGEKFDSKGKKLKELDKDTISQIPRVTSKLNRRISTDVARNDVTILYLSQVRANISLGGPGAPDQPQGGNSVLHHSATIMRLHRSYAKDKVLKNETEYLQWPVVLTFEKNKVNGIEGKQIEFIWERQKGPNIEISTLYSALKADIIIQSSSWFSYKDIKVQGFDKFCELALEEREIYDAICRELAGEVEKEKEEIKEEVKNETEEE